MSRNRFTKRDETTFIAMKNKISMKIIYRSHGIKSIFRTERERERGREREKEKERERKRKRERERERERERK